MINVNRIGDFMEVTCLEKSVTCKYTEEKFKTLMMYVDTSQTVENMDELNSMWEEVETFCNKEDEGVIDTDLAVFKKNQKTGKYHLHYNNIVYPIPLPEAFVRRVEISEERSISIEPLVKCWLRFMRNPKVENENFRKRFFNYIDMTYVKPDVKAKKLEEGFSEELATQFATVYQVKITQEGLINCYKVSEEVDWKFEADKDVQDVYNSIFDSRTKVHRYTRTFDADTGEVTGDSRDNLPVEERLFRPAVQGDNGDAFYCGDQKGHFIRVGKEHYLESWDQVDCDDRRSCVKGLHAGGLNYIANYPGEIHNVFIDPMFIGAIPDDNTGAMRVLKYFVHSSWVGVNKSIYHSSEYAKKTDEEWEEIKRESINEILEKQQALEDKINDLTNL